MASFGPPYVGWRIDAQRPAVTHELTVPKLARVSARLNPEVARKLADLQRRTGKSVSEVLAESIERHHAAVTAEGEASTLLEQAGFVACGDGPADLSRTYKPFRKLLLG